MPDSPPRRWNLVDGMIVIAGLAACFLLTRHYLTEYYPAIVRRLDNISPVNHFWWDCYVTEGIRVATLWLAIFSPLVLLIRLRQPRPYLPDLLRQPGAVVSVAATLITVVGLGCWAIVAVIEGQALGLFLYRVSFARILTQTGAVVAVAWILAFLTGQCSPERSVIDQAGRFLGVCWILVWLVSIGSELHQGAILGVGNTWQEHRAYTGSNLIDHN